MQTIRMTNYRKKKAAQTAYKVWVENGKVDFKVIPSEARQSYYDRPTKAERTVAQLAADADMSERYTAQNESRRVLAEQLAMAPDHRADVESMRARIAERFGPLMPLGRRGWTA